MLGAAGGVGLAAVELGAAMGAHVIAAASSDEKLAACRAFGAAETVNYTAVDLKAWLKEHTGGTGVDVVYDPVGGALSEPALRSMAWKGRFLVIGFAAGDIPRVPLNLPLLKGCSVIGVFYGEHGTRSPARAAGAGRRADRHARRRADQPVGDGAVPAGAVRRRPARADGPPVVGKAVVLPHA